MAELEEDAEDGVEAPSIVVASTVYSVPPPQATADTRGRSNWKNAVEKYHLNAQAALVDRTCRKRIVEEKQKIISV